MSLSQALATSSSGLRTTQAGLSLVASNVANAQTPGFIRKTLIQHASVGGTGAGGVQVAAIARELDQYVQRQLRIETSGGAFADLRAQFYDRLQGIYGTPGAASAFETVFNNFTNAAQALATSPDSTSARSSVLTSAQVLAQQLNSMTDDIQGLRSDAERGIAEAVTVANEAMRQIASINGQLGTMPAGSAAAAALEDQRDVFIDQLTQLIDIKVVMNGQNQANVFTNSGIQLVGTSASRFTFNPQGTMSAQTVWSGNPSESAVGSLMLVSPSGGTFDLISNNSIRSGELAAYIEMRDRVLVEAQSQLDQIAAAMSSALSDKTTAGDPVTAGAQAGFEFDVADLLPGNMINLSYTDTSTGKQHRVSIVHVDDPSALPLTDDATNDPDDRVIGVDLSGGLAAVAAYLTGQLNGKLQFSTSGGSMLRVLDDGAANNINITAATATQTVTDLAGGSAEIPFFTDAHNAYSGAITADGPQSVGLAGRITVNAALLADPSKLVAYAAGTSVGDSTRPDFLFEQLTGASLDFSPASGIGSTDSPFEASLTSFIRQMLSHQGSAANAAASLAEGQGVVVNALQARITEGSGVNVDREMANLLTLQAAYAANARVMSAVRDMLDLLMKI